MKSGCLSPIIADGMFTLRRRGRRLTRMGLSKILNAMAKRVEVAHVSPHVLRHSQPSLAFSSHVKRSAGLAEFPGSLNSLSHVAHQCSESQERPVYLPCTLSSAALGDAQEMLINVEIFSLFRGREHNTRV